MGTFISRLCVTPLKNGVDWQLTEDFGYQVGHRESKEVIRVGTGFKTDFASVPQLFITLGGIAISAIGFFLHHPSLYVIGAAVVFLAILFPKAGEYSEAAVIHDYLYQNHDGKDRKYADDRFRDAMHDLHVNGFKILVMYWSVRIFGGAAWRPKVRRIAKALRYGRKSFARRVPSQVSAVAS